MSRARRIAGEAYLRQQRWRFERALVRRDAAGIASAWLRAMTPIDVPGLAQGGIHRRLVVLPKVGGTEDVVATVSGRGEAGVELVGLRRSAVKAVFRAALGGFHTSLTETDYRSMDRLVDEAKERYRVLLTEVLGRLSGEFRIDGFVSPNVTYFAEQELAAACEEVGIPFIVLHKEAIRTEEQRLAFTRAYRERNGVFRGRLVATYNEDEARSQSHSGMVAADHIRVVGCPRVDVLHRRRERGDHAGDGPTVLFAVDPDAGTWTPFDTDGPSGAPRWLELADATERAFVRAAAANPSRDFVLKVKVGREQQVAERLGRDLAGRLPENLEVVTGGTATELLGRASAVIGFNSTVLLEGLASGVPVIVPHLAEASDPDTAVWRFRLEGAVTVVESEGELVDAIGRAWDAGRSELLTPAASEALATYLGNPDGRASDRAWEAIRSAIEPA